MPKTQGAPEAEDENQDVFLSTMSRICATEITLSPSYHAAASSSAKHISALIHTRQSHARAASRTSSPAARADISVGYQRPAADA